jgi:signal transduction histidine kinase
MTPLAGALAVRELWSRHRTNSELRAREQLAERSRQEAVAAAEAARRTREEFLARMSHEFRTPLNAVIGFARVLQANKAGNQRPEDLAMLERVSAGGEQLLRLIDDVLDQSLIRHGQLALTLEEVDVGHVTAHVLPRHRQAAEARGLRFEAVVPPSTPTVRLDRRRYEQVLSNLLDNAVKFTERGSVRVVLVSDLAGCPLRLTVSDTGIGIPAHRLEEVFEPFGQAETGHGRSHDGPGLGLSLARRLCHGMGCQLVVESRQGAGSGSRFTVVFPRSR